MPADRLTRRRLVAVLTTMVLAGAGATFTLTATVAPAQAAAGVEAALAHFQQAQRSGDSAAIDDAAQRFARLIEQHPADPVLRAYLGAATALRATTTVLPWRKLQHADDGLALLDKAMAQLSSAHDAPAHRGVPAALETHFVAASTFLRLPAMFNRRDSGRRLLAGVLASPLFDAAPIGFRATVWLRAGQQAEADGEPAKARAFYERAAVSDAAAAAFVRGRLKEL
jgi:hypothetical protein